MTAPNKCPKCGVDVLLPDWPYDYCPSCAAEMDIKPAPWDIMVKFDEKAVLWGHDDEV